MNDSPPVDAAHPTNQVAAVLARAAAAVGAVAKDSTHQSNVATYKFRGIDAVVNACAPVLHAHGVLVHPSLVEVTYDTVEVGANRKPTGFARVIVDYVFTGPLGDRIVARVPGEAMDSGDKAVPKAMSVAFRTALLQTLSLPTDDPEPDASAYERSDVTALTPAQEAAANEYAESIRTCDDDDTLRRLWQELAETALPEHARAGLRSLINERKRQLDARASVGMPS